VVSQQNPKCVLWVKLVTFVAYLVAKVDRNSLLCTLRLLERCKCCIKLELIEISRKLSHVIWTTQMQLCGSILCLECRWRIKHVNTITNILINWWLSISRQLTSPCWLRLFCWLLNLRYKSIRIGDLKVWITSGGPQPPYHHIIQPFSSSLHPLDH